MSIYKYTYTYVYRTSSNLYIPDSLAHFVRSPISFVPCFLKLVNWLEIFVYYILTLPYSAHKYLVKNTILSNNSGTCSSVLLLKACTYVKLTKIFLVGDVFVCYFSTN